MSNAITIESAKLGESDYLSALNSIPIHMLQSLPSGSLGREWMQTLPARFSFRMPDGRVPVGRSGKMEWMSCPEEAARVGRSWGATLLVRMVAHPIEGSKWVIVEETAI